MDTAAEIPVGQARYLSCAETAKLIRAELKTAFPAVKFSVRSSTYANGASIRVGWEDGPTSKRVDTVAGRFAGATFDGMIDLKSYHESRYKGERLHFGADFVFCERKVSDSWRDEILARFSAIIGRTITLNQWGSWDWQMVPLAVERFGDDAGRLLHMVESCQEDLSTVFHQYTGFRSRYNGEEAIEL